jgi:ferredoxin-type protein NapF
MSLSRRSFLGARFRRAGQEFRPPRALPAGAFEERCNRCGECAKACPARIIARGSGGFPKIDFTHGACSFCGDCVRACAAGALRRTDGGAPWRLEARIGDACLALRGVECRICGECCDAGAIRFRPCRGAVAQPRLDADLCSGCGACVAPCPAGAIGMTNGPENDE